MQLFRLSDRPKVRSLSRGPGPHMCQVTPTDTLPEYTLGEICLCQDATLSLEFVHGTGAWSSPHSTVP